jgi:hypothetical protein
MRGVAGGGDAAAHDQLCPVRQHCAGGLGGLPELSAATRATTAAIVKWAFFMHYRAGSEPARLVDDVAQLLTGQKTPANFLLSTSKRHWPSS